MESIRAIDLFSGAGGSSWGARLAGVEVVAGFDAWSVAGAAYQENFPEAGFYQSRLEDVNPGDLKRELGRINLIIASPECTNHSPAKGSGPRCEKSKATAFQVVRFARELEPRWIVVENVTSMRHWTRYGEFIDELRSLGYHVATSVLNAKDFGVPQSRRRLFILCDREATPPAVEGKLADPKSASAILSPDGTFSSSPLRAPRRAEATLARARRAIQTVGNRAFLLVYYGSDKGGGWQRLSRPLRTITTLDRFALVAPNRGNHVMRMLQVPELKRGMGMPQRFSLGCTTRRNSIKLLGNAVCPPVMRYAVRTLTGD